MIAEGRILFPSSIKGRPREKKFLKDLRKDVTGFSSILPPESVGYTTNGTRLIQKLGLGEAFDFPKSEDLVRTLISQATDKDDFILDSFAGSGTTAHAVQTLNKSDGGHRKFILIELLDYAKTVTATRVKRMIQGTEAIEAVGGNFSYYELSENPILSETGEFDPSLSLDEIRDFVWKSETRTQRDSKAASDEGLLGTHHGTAVYLLYGKDGPMPFERRNLRSLKRDADRHVVYAGSCAFSSEELERMNITFKKLPRDLSRC
jgi:adenine-specific DNA-methyltransferase